MDIIYCFGDSFSYRTPPRDYEKFPIEESNQKAQGKQKVRGHNKITQLKNKHAGKLLLSQIAGKIIKNICEYGSSVCRRSVLSISKPNYFTVDHKNVKSPNVFFSCLRDFFLFLHFPPTDSPHK